MHTIIQPTVHGSHTYHGVSTLFSALALMLLMAVGVSTPMEAKAASLEQGDARLAYQQLKVAVAQGAKEPDTLGHLFEGDVDTDLFVCESPAMIGWGEQERFYEAADIALYSVILESRLTRLKIPVEVWKPYVDRLDALGVDSIEYERKQVRNSPKGTPSEKEFEDAEKRWNAVERRRQKAVREPLVAALSRYRKENPKADVPEFVLDGGCGDGELEVEITISPTDGSLRVIPQFRHELCRLEGANPDDPKTCSGWRDVVHPKEPLVGRYMYIAKWPDGYEKRGEFRVISDGPITIKR